MIGRRLGIVFACVLIMTLTALGTSPSSAYSPGPRHNVSELGRQGATDRQRGRP